MRNRALIRLWLGFVLVTILALVIVGGATRLTDSGLSITEWKPIHGVIPPLSEAEWQEELELYRQIPQYQQINKGMSLEAFKVIYWWEWAHRLLARSVGVVFALPLIVLWASGRIEPRLRWPLLGALALGGLQGFIGWWMVTSGLSERVSVSHYRLATHLTLACLIVASLVWIREGLKPGPQTQKDNDRAPRSMTWFAAILSSLILFQIYLGGLVAGLDAGYAYNTWPLMDGALVPQNLFVLDPAWRNFFDNPKLVQFTHRLVAYSVWIATACYALLAWHQARQGGHARTAWRALVLFALVSAQAVIGIVTLVLVVPISWGLLHQGGAVIVLGYAMANWRWLVGPYALPFQQNGRQTNADRQAGKTTQ